MLQEIRDWLVFFLVLAGFLAAGALARLLLRISLSRLGRRTGSRFYEVLSRGLGTPLFLLFLLVGLGCALPRIPGVPPEVTEHLPLLLSLLLTLVGAVVAARVLSGLLEHYGSVRPALKGVIPLLSRALKALVAFVALILILNSLGINVTALVAGLGVAGIAVAFALQETLSQFFAGLYLMSERPIRVGDYIRLESGEEGYVVDVGWRSTKIRQLSNDLVIVPNSKLAGSRIINFYLPDPQSACLVQVGVSYNSDLEKVERVTVEVAKEVMRRVEGEIPGFEPFIRYHTFGDFSIQFTVVLRVKEYTNRYRLIHEFIKELHRRYREEGIEIPFPVRTVYLRGDREED